ncbi:MAG: hypothetical protein IKL18_04275 [Oscillospiraceae bacterium]|nr:hypothetical protein [Oscillospiraceae bacterium]MBR6657371.1 hypothetical protein [Oscillospiraceae bacterium]
MKKLAAFLIVAMVLTMSTAMLKNIFSAEKPFLEELSFEEIEHTLSENVPFREEFSGLMDTIRYFSGVRHFEDIYIGSEGSLLLDIKKPTSRIFSSAKNYILGFSEKNQIRPYVMLIPSASVILQQEIDNFSGKDIYNQRNMINNMYSEFEGKVRTTDIYQTLYDHRGEYIFYHTENLPTSLGGYYIYGELCNRLGIEQNKMDSFSAIYAAHGFYGNLATDFLKQYSSPDFISFYEHEKNKNVILEHRKNDGSVRISESLFVFNENNFADKTDMIFGGISPVMEITSPESIGERKSILIFGDESAKSWLPFLVTNFERITFVELNLAEEKLLSRISVSDYDHVLFAYSTSAFVSGIDFEKLEFIG